MQPININTRSRVFPAASMAVVYADSTWLSWSQQSLCSCVAMQQFLKFYEAAHAYVEQSGYADALVYFDSALRELERYGQQACVALQPYTLDTSRNTTACAGDNLPQNRMTHTHAAKYSHCWRL